MLCHGHVGTMFLKRRETRPWVWAEAVEPAVDFCVWVLLSDGLQVPPFNLHAEGSGRLRAVGLDASNWRDWLESVVAAQLGLSQLVQGVANLTRLTERDASDLAGGLEKTRPPSSWGGDDAVRDLLTSLWSAYEPEGEAWRRHVAGSGGPAELTPSDRRRIWQEIGPRREPGEALTIYPVRYPVPVVDIVPPAALVLAVGRGRGPETYLRLLQEGLARLDEAGPQVIN
jgi:hypothetical protein